MKNPIKGILRKNVLITICVVFVSLRIIANTKFPENTSSFPWDTIKQNTLLPESIAFDTRISFEGGLSRRTAVVSPELPENLQEFYGNLRNGSHFFFNASTYLKNSRFGIGFNFSLSRYSHEDNHFNYFDSSGTLAAIGFITETINIPMIAPGLYYHKFFSDNRCCFNAGLFAGLTLYKDRLIVLNNAIAIDARTIGAGAFAGFDYILYKSVAFGFSFSYVYGKLGKVIIDGEPVTLGTNEEEGIQRIGIDAGLKFYF